MMSQELLLIIFLHLHRNLQSASQTTTVAIPTSPNPMRIAHRSSPGFRAVPQKLTRPWPRATHQQLQHSGSSGFLLRL